MRHNIDCAGRTFCQKAAINVTYAELLKWMTYQAWRLTMSKHSLTVRFVRFGKNDRKVEKKDSQGFSDCNVLMLVKFNSKNISYQEPRKNMWKIKAIVSHQKNKANTNLDNSSECFIWYEILCLLLVHFDPTMPINKKCQRLPNEVQPCIPSDLMVRKCTPQHCNIFQIES